MASGSNHIDSLEQSQAIHKYHIDIMRIMAIMFVIFNHLHPHGFMLFIESKQSPFFWLYMGMAVLCKVAAPLFFMISGALLIPKRESVQDLYKNRVLRYVIILLLFSFLFYLYSCYQNETAIDMGNFFKRLALEMFSAAATYWYLSAHIATLMMMPMLRKLAVAMDNRDYGMLFLFHIALVGIQPILNYLLWGSLGINPNFTIALATSNNIFFVLLGYFVEYRVDKKYFLPKYVFLANAASFLAIAISCLMTHYRGQVMGFYSFMDSQNFFFVLIAIPSFSIYFTLKYLMRNAKKNRLLQVVSYCSGLTLGVMLLEEVIRLKLYFIHEKMIVHINAMVSSMLFVVIVFIVAALITIVLKKLPGLRKLL